MDPSFSLLKKKNCQPLGRHLFVACVVWENSFVFFPLRRRKIIHSSSSSSSPSFLIAFREKKDQQLLTGNESPSERERRSRDKHSSSSSSSVSILVLLVCKVRADTSWGVFMEHVRGRFASRSSTHLTVWTVVLRPSLREVELDRPIESALRYAKRQQLKSFLSPRARTLCTSFCV